MKTPEIDLKFVTIKINLTTYKTRSSSEQFTNLKLKRQNTFSISLLSNIQKSWITVVFVYRHKRSLLSLTPLLRLYFTTWGEHDLDLLSFKMLSNLHSAKMLRDISIYGNIGKDRKVGLLV